MDDQGHSERVPALERRFVSFRENELVHGLDLSRLFGDAPGSLSLAKTSACLPDGLQLDGGILSGVVPALSQPLTLTLRSQAPPDAPLRILDIVVRCALVVQCDWRGRYLDVRVTQNLLETTGELRLAEISVGSQDRHADVHTDRVLLTPTPDGDYHLDTPLRPGVTYMLSYDIPEPDPAVMIKLADGAGGPMGDDTLPVSSGTNRVFLRPQKRVQGVLFSTVGMLAMTNVTCQQATWSVDVPAHDAGAAIIWRVTSGAHEVTGTSQARVPGALYVAPDGEDQPHRGGPDTPFRHPGYAARHAQPGDMVYLRPGTYPPFIIENSGRPGAPITFTTLPGEERQAVISAAGDDSFRLAGILIPGQDHIIIRNLVVEDMLLSGICVLGTQGEIHGHHVLSGNLIRRTGNAGIFIKGYLPHQTLAADDVRITDIIIEHNDVSQTNVPTSYNAFKGGVNECISVAAGVDGVITRYNHIHDSRQYGIDYKLGVRNGQIYGNRIWNIERYGIYLDTARRYVENIDIFNNEIFRCGLGITLAREAVTDAQDPVQMADLVQTLRNINIFNNVIYDIERTGIYCHDHPKDRPEGTISGIHIRFNTIVNCATSGVGNEVRLVGWTKPEWSGVLSDFDFIGNILWRPGSRRTQSLFDDFSGAPAVQIDQNLIGIDPLFAGPDDFRLSEASPARGMVDAGFAMAPFDRTISGESRRARPDAGAY